MYIYTYTHRKAQKDDGFVGDLQDTNVAVLPVCVYVYMYIYIHTHRKAQQDDGFVGDPQETSANLDSYFFHFAQLPKVITKYQLILSRCV
jgi:hypothetical protein